MVSSISGKFVYNLRFRLYHCITSIVTEEKLSKMGLWQWLCDKFGSGGGETEHPGWNGLLLCLAVVAVAVFRY